MSMILRIMYMNLRIWYCFYLPLRASFGLVGNSHNGASAAACLWLGQSQTTRFQPDFAQICSSRTNLRVVHDFEKSATRRGLVMWHACVLQFFQLRRTKTPRRKFGMTEIWGNRMTYPFMEVIPRTSARNKISISFKLSSESVFSWFHWRRLPILTLLLLKTS